MPNKGFEEWVFKCTDYFAITYFDFGLSLKMIQFLCLKPYFFPYRMNSWTKDDFKFYFMILVLKYLK